MARLAAGDFKLAYVAPERLGFPGFRALARELDCPLVAVDEAHCISEWGHDFRPEYLEIGGLLAELPRARVLACTATATPVVRDEILARLNLPRTRRSSCAASRAPTWACARWRRITRASATDDRRGARGDARAPRGRAGPAIVYASTRKSAEEEGARLAGLGWRVAVYHAGLSPAERDRAQGRFAAGQAEIVTATNAFGMGIDRPDVRGGHSSRSPSSLEAYYQEVGRAGRDGSRRWACSSCRRAISPSVARSSSAAARARRRRPRWWSTSGALSRAGALGGGRLLPPRRHPPLLRDEAETLHGCGRCDVCLALADPAAGAAGLDPAATTLVIRKALSGVARVHERFGLGTAVKLLHGEADPRLERAGLMRLQTFGNLREHAEEWILGCCAGAWPRAG
jgi:ATP-dependent DNA helicase RecQ